MLSFAFRVFVGNVIVVDAGGISSFARVVVCVVGVVSFVGVVCVLVGVGVVWFVVVLVVCRLLVAHAP